MQKIILAIDGLHYKQPVVEFAASLSKHLHSHLVGLFLHDRTYHSYKIYDIEKGNMMTSEQVEQAEQKDIGLRKAALGLFEQECDLHTLQHSHREHKDIALPELIRESLFADLLVVHAGEQFTHYPENRPSAFLRGLMEEARCPVILVPDHTPPLKKAILLYDGTPESVYAIKIFCASFSIYAPPLSIELYSVNKPDQSLHLHNNKLIKEYLKRHFPKATFTVVKGDINPKIIAALRKETADTLIVLGAYRRGMVSRWLRPSMADILLSTVKLPLFIAHSK